MSTENHAPALETAVAWLAVDVALTDGDPDRARALADRAIAQFGWDGYPVLRDVRDVDTCTALTVRLCENLPKGWLYHLTTGSSTALLTRPEAQEFVVAASARGRLENVAQHLGSGLLRLDAILAELLKRALHADGIPTEDL